MTPDQGDLLTAIERLTNQEIACCAYQDFSPGQLPAEISAKRDLARQREENSKVEHSRVRETPPTPEEAADSAKFPGGIVPADLPSHRMGGRVRTRRR